MPQLFKLTALLCLLGFSSGYAQDSTIDSVKLVLQNPKIHDTTKLYTLATAMDSYSQNDPKFVALNTQMGKLALRKYNEGAAPGLHKVYTSYLAVYYNNLGSQYSKKRDIANTLAYTGKSIALFKSSGMYDEMHFAIISKAIFLSKIDEYDKAITALFTALNYFEKDRKNKGGEISYAQSSLAKIYADFGKYGKAITYNKKVIDYYESKKPMTAEDEWALATACINSGSSYLELKKYDQAMRHFNKALALFAKVGDKNNKSVALTKMALVKIEESKFDEAKMFLDRSLEEGISPIHAANAYVKLGMLYNRKKDFKKADFYLSKGLALSKENDVLELQEQASGLLFRVSRENKDFEKALEMYEFHDKLVDADKTEASKNMLAQQQLKYDFEKKELNYKFETEKENASKNNLLTALSAVLLLLVSGGYFYYRNNKQKQAINILEKNQIRQRLLIAQMNPHFIFNSIQNIRSLIYDKKDADAVDYLNKFSKLTRQILENSNENYISLAEEVEMITNYLAIQQLLYGYSFEYGIKVADDIETDALFLPPMLTQPFIENAIKHGLSGKSENGRIDISFYLNEGKLYFEVIDNGSGFDASKKQAGHKSMAMAITKERLANYTKDREFTIRTHNITDEHQHVSGAKVIFEIPYIYEN